MSIDYAKKLLAIRQAEGLTQQKFSEITGLSLGFIKIYESGHRPARSETIEKVLQIERFERYTLWLMNGSIAPEAGQIAPTLSDGKLRESKVKSDGIERKAEEVVAQISTQQHDIKDIMNSLSNLDGDELKQLSKLLSRRGAIFLLELLDQDNQELIGLDGGKKQAALQLKSMNKEQVREILSKIEGNNRQFTKDINDFTEKAS